MQLKQIVRIVLARTNCKIQSIRKVRNCYITYAGGWDGGCAQIHSIISIMLFAKKYNLTYVHTSVKNVEHYKGNRDEWSLRWENFFSLGNKEIAIESLDSNKIKSIFVKFPILLNKKKNTLFQVSNCHTYTETCTADYSLLVDDLRRKFEIQNRIQEEKSNNELKINVHIRRGDVNRQNNNSFRFTSNDIIIENLSKIVEFFERNNIRFKVFIFSEGDEEDFKEFSRFNAVLNLNLDEFITFNNLVNADILVMAKSSYSYVAALLNQGIVFYEPFWHQPIPSWIDITSGKQQIANILSKKINNKFVSKPGGNSIV